MRWLHYSSDTTLCVTSCTHHLKQTSHQIEGVYHPQYLNCFRPQVTAAANDWNILQNPLKLITDFHQHFQD